MKNILNIYKKLNKTDKILIPSFVIITIILLILAMPQLALNYSYKFNLIQYSELVISSFKATYEYEGRYPGKKEFIKRNYHRLGFKPRLYEYTVSKQHYEMKLIVVHPSSRDELYPARIFSPGMVCWEDKAYDSSEINSIDWENLDYECEWINR